MLTIRWGVGSALAYALPVLVGGALIASARETGRDAGPELSASKDAAGWRGKVGTRAR